jgi:peptidoglycan hydrolase CwlO-like protein
MMTIIKEWLPLIIVGFNAAFFVIVKFNDLVHLDKKLDKIEKKLEDMDKKLDTTSERISKQEGKCTANHG